MTGMPLSDIVPGYPQDHPQSLAGLVDAELENLHNPIAKELRAQALAVVRGWDQHYVNGPWDVMDLITSGYVLHPWEKAWKSYALSSTRQPILKPTEKGRMSYLNKATRLLPKPDELPPLHLGVKGNQPTWLVIYGGNPDILEKEPVRKGLTRLVNKAPVADVVFYENSPNSQPKLWSVRAGTGIAGTNRTSAKEEPFPNVEFIETIRSGL